ncbi:N-acetyl-gamma-glutamyl-phosphate reductase [Candidatus Puniceispirillum marinum]|uniref:N-acetyl-gamma-glutamyl-phosphate reductase n=1 Tax=Puniceispirillum marinum (strain IMCC1322) TaxID=488538 RepID=D5BSX3_PUNMI|nr:N-acetyl-gamma-glutamyl-phosphate reductase [Candidatus Puniceispirillum marinum]ADE39370.1 N-acetyl-gamma-glutamyl-phosphate reductase [Candidatus Puniceispirillum marinum IMCC1322]
MSYNVFIDGEAGTTGLKVASRLALHPHVQILHLDDAVRKDMSARLDMIAKADVTILCLPDVAAIEVATAANGMDANAIDICLIDASTAHRTDPEWAYGFAEMDAAQRRLLASSKRISNPGCYPTGAIALLRPLIKSGIIPADADITVPAVSGYSGGGNAMIALHDAGDLAPHLAYATDLKHKHVPEMQLYSGLDKAPLFMPSVGNFYAGMLVHVPLHASQLAVPVSASAIYDLLRDWYADSALIAMGAAGANDLAGQTTMAADALAGRNDMELFVFANKDESQFWLTARLDNLGKGASGAAVQNMNIALGIAEDTALV